MEVGAATLFFASVSKQPWASLACNVPIKGAGEEEVMDFSCTSVCSICGNTGSKPLSLHVHVHVHVHVNT